MVAYRMACARLPRVKGPSDCAEVLLAYCVGAAGNPSSHTKLWFVRNTVSQRMITPKSSHTAHPLMRPKTEQPRTQRSREIPKICVVISDIVDDLYKLNDIQDKITHQLYSDLLQQVDRLQGMKTSVQDATKDKKKPRIRVTEGGEKTPIRGCFKNTRQDTISSKRPRRYTYCLPYF